MYMCVAFLSFTFLDGYRNIFIWIGVVYFPFLLYRLQFLRNDGNELPSGWVFRSHATIVTMDFLICKLNYCKRNHISCGHCCNVNVFAIAFVTDIE